MFKSLLTMSAIMMATSAFAAETPIVGNVASKCSIYTDTSGVYGNPTPGTLSTAPADGGVKPVVRYDVATPDAYTAKILWPNAFSTSPNLTDSLTWNGAIAVSNTSVAGMSAYEAAKIEYDNATEYNLSLAGSTWFSVDSNVAYGVGKAFPGGVYKAFVTAECIAK